MTHYATEADAAADGFSFGHDTDRHLFTVASDDQVVGTAHYSLSEADGVSTINFDGTQVVPALRGTGLAALLAHRAFTDAIVRGRTIKTSCWYMADYLGAHPELRG